MNLRDSLLNRTVVVASLGYFVDVFDLVMFSIVRIQSLRDLGYSGEDLADVGLTLMNYQMAGLLLGGIAWGCLGDKRGRLTVLFGSIALYSVANIANAFVNDAGTYAFLRFAAGFGLAGELGAAVTLVSESLPVRFRGYATSLIASVGILGAIAAALVADWVDWRSAYAVGGVLGLVLLFTRAHLSDSSLFEHVRATGVVRGNFLMLFRTRERFARYLWTIAIGVPCWFVLGILLAFGPEITSALGIVGSVVVGTGVMCQYAGAAMGDIATGFISQRIQSRKRVVGVCLGATAFFIGAFLLPSGMTPAYYYVLYFCLGFVTGYWAVFVTMAAEQFGTNLRATAASTIPNFVRGSVIPIGLAIQWIKPDLGMVKAVGLVGVAVLMAAWFALGRVRETYAIDLDYVEA